MKNPIFVTGMFRSGTTLLARMLNMHPQIAFASDTYQPTLKAFRNAVADELSDEHDPRAPFDDYYFDANRIELMERIQATSLDLPIGRLPLPMLREQIGAYCKEFSPRLLDYLDTIDGDTFFELIATGFTAVDRAYGGPETTATGFKITWSGEFVPHILASFPNAKAIEIIRDPRAVCASKKASSVGMYPWLFLARQWRKLMTMTWIHTLQGAETNDRVLVVRYEDLVRHPRPVAERICAFLGLDFSPEIIATSGIVDGEGKAWTGNSSHYQKKRGISQHSIEKWRDILVPEEVTLIERLCYAEMKMFDYAPTEADEFSIPPDMVRSAPEVPQDQLANWIAGDANHEARLFREMALEHWRCSVLHDGTGISDDIKIACCLDPRFFDAARVAI